LQLLELIAEAAGLDGSAGSVGFGKEEEDDRLAAKVFQVHGLAIFIWDTDVRYLIANFHAEFFLEEFSRSFI